MPQAKSASKNGAAKTLTVEQIKAAPDVQEHELHIPEWGGTVKVRSLTMAQLDRVRQRATVGEDIDLTLFAVYQAIEGVVDPDFGPDDAEWLRDKSSSAIAKINVWLNSATGGTEDEVAAATRTFRN